VLHDPGKTALFENLKNGARGHGFHLSKPAFAFSEP